jgi:hypothetical protein
LQVTKYPMRHHLVNYPYSLDSFLASQNNYYFFTTTEKWLVYKSEKGQVYSK